MKGISNNHIILLNAEPIIKDFYPVCKQHPGTYEEIAARCDSNFNAVFNQVSGRTRGLRFDFLKEGHDITGSNRLERHVLSPGRRSIPITSAPATMDPEREAGDVSISAGLLHTSVRKATCPEGDGGVRITVDEERRIRSDVEQAQRELQDILNLLDEARARGGLLPGAED